MRYLLGRGADVNAAAARHGGLTALEGACLVGEVGVVRGLLAAGAAVDGGTALCAAAEGGWGEVVRVLLGAGADVDGRVGRMGMRGQTAVQSACVMGHGEVVGILLEAGATGSVYGGRRMYGSVGTRSWSEEEMGVGCEDEERGRAASGRRQRAPSPNPLAKRTAYYNAEYSKLGRRTT